MPIVDIEPDPDQKKTQPSSDARERELVEGAEQVTIPSCAGRGPRLGGPGRPTAIAGLRVSYPVQVNQAHVFDAPVVTRIEPGREFYPAEDYHQDFLTRNPQYPYIVINDLPKVDNLMRLFPDLYRATPVLVATAAPRS